MLCLPNISPRLENKGSSKSIIVNYQDNKQGEANSSGNLSDHEDKHE